MASEASPVLRPFHELTPTTVSHGLYEFAGRTGLRLAEVELIAESAASDRYRGREAEIERQVLREWGDGVERSLILTPQDYSRGKLPEVAGGTEVQLRTLAAYTPSRRHRSLSDSKSYSEAGEVALMSIWTADSQFDQFIAAGRQLVAEVAARPGGIAAGVLLTSKQHEGRDKTQGQLRSAIGRIGLSPWSEGYWAIPGPPTWRGRPTWLPVGYRALYLNRVRQ